MARRFAFVLGVGVTLAGLAFAFSEAAPKAASGAVIVPRFTLGATTATVDDEVSLRVADVPRLSQRHIRLYLVPTGVAASIRSRFDPRLSFVGTVRALRHARLLFTVPPLEAGSYAVAYWCRGCTPRGARIGIAVSPKLRVTAAGAECPTTKANGNVPPGSPQSWEGFQWHGNGKLWTWLRPDGTLGTNALGGAKLIWLAEGSGLFRVRYWPLDSPSSPVTAPVVSGTLVDYDGSASSWASRMSFQPGCWQITGRLGDVSLSFVASTVLGSS